MCCFDCTFSSNVTSVTCFNLKYQCTTKHSEIIRMKMFGIRMHDKLDNDLQSPHDSQSCKTQCDMTADI